MTVLNPDELRKMHHIDNLTIAEIAKMKGVTFQAVRQRMSKLGIEIIPATRRLRQPRKHELNDEYFKAIDTPDKAYWLGFIMADGCVQVTKKGQKNPGRLSFTLMASDAAHLQKLLDALQCKTIAIGYKETPECRFQSDGKEIKIRASQACYLAINSVDLCRHLINQGVHPRKTSNEQVPHIPNHLVRHFIRGFFDGDGCFSLVKPKNRPNAYPKVFISSGKDIIEYIANQTANHIGVMMGIGKQRNLTRCTIQNKSDIIMFMNWLYEDAEIYLERKYRLYNEYLAKI